MTTTSTLAAVRAEITAVNGYTTRPGVAAGCEKMAGIIDNPRLAAVAPDALQALADGLERLRDAATPVNTRNGSPRMPTHLVAKG
jgi:hypothetical protein